MARKAVSDIASYASLSLEGNLIAPAMIASIDQREAAEQSEESYNVRKGLTLRDEISLAFRVGQAHFDGFAKRSETSAAGTGRFIRSFLTETFGFSDISEAQSPLAFAAGGGRVPVVVVPPSDPIDRASATLSTERRRSAAFALQDWLNEHDDALWGIATNGATLQLMRDNASLTRPAYIEASLAQIFETEDIASFAVLWLLIHRTRFGKLGTPPTDCALERWRDAGAKEGQVARDKLASQVEEALKLLGSGFLEANPELREKISSGQLPLTQWFNELLRLVYRLIFLMVAEDRNLLHSPDASADARRLYLEGYSLGALRSSAIRRSAWDRHHDRYEGLKVVFKALSNGEPLLGLPALGGLFSAGQLPELEGARICNQALLNALYRLSWLTQDGVLVPVNWRLMETEELGSVYESLLELQPQIAPNGRQLLFAQDVDEQKGNQRKTTGSYYTPDSLVQALLDTALDPVLDRTEAEADDPGKALLKLSVIDPACGSGHFLLAAARRIATRLARIRSEGTPSLADFRHALRDVARCCIHGVDRNPMAVELTKVALWIETVDPGLPLGFFDAQIRCGDALLGVFDPMVLQVGIPDTAYKPLTGDDKEIANIYKKANAAAKAGQGGLDFGSGINKLPETKPLALDFSGFRDLPEDTVEQIGAKAARFNELRKDQTFIRAAIACDLYVAAFLLPKTGNAPSGPSERTIPTTEELWLALNEGIIRPSMMEAPKAALEARTFHWQLEYPDVMQRGGFDVVLGNPPWERIKLQEQEFFAARSPEIANAANKAARDRLIKSLEKGLPGSASRTLFDAFIEAKREAEAAGQFARVGKDDFGRFPLCGQGDLNTYGLFAELAKNLANPRGRVGVIVPSEILSSDASKEFFQSIIKENKLRSSFAFENEEFIFPGIANVNRFTLLTLGAEGIGDSDIKLAFYLRRAEHLSEPDRIFTLKASDFADMNPNTLTCPVFRTKTDAELTARLYRTFPVLINEAARIENAWGITFMRMFDMANDSNLFVDDSAIRANTEQKNGTRRDSGSAQIYLPLYEGKFLWHYDHRFSSYHNLGKIKGRGGRGLPPVQASEYANPEFEITPRYWLEKQSVDDRLSELDHKNQWLMGWRDVTSAKLERTMVCGVLPRWGANHKLPLFFTKQEPRLSACLLCNFSSLTFDFVARQKMGGTSFAYFYLKQLPIFPPAFYAQPRLAFIIPKVLELTYTSHSLTPFARDLGYDGQPFVWDEDRREHLRADLDAFYARAYGLTRDELRYILDPSDVKGPDYPSETFRVLKERETRQFGEYRTRRLVLEAWDHMEASGAFAALGL